MSIDFKDAMNSSTDTMADVNNSIQKYKSLLLDRSDGGRNLTEIIKMLEISYKSVIDNLSMFRRLSFDTDANKAKADDFLFHGRYGYITGDIMRARARCTIIEDVLNDFLENWFDKFDKFDSNLSKELKSLFRNRLIGDKIFVDHAEAVGLFLKEKCKEINHLVEDGNLKLATAKVKMYSQELEPLLDRMSEEWQKLAALEAEFREKTSRKLQ